MNLLVKAFIKNSKDTQNPSVRTAYGKLSSIVGIICNAILFAGKITVGLLSGSVSITADAVNNLSDASSSIISLLGFKLAEKPPDQEHPYGHGRYEYLAGLMVAVLILVIGIELFRNSMGKVIHPTPVEFGGVTIGILAGSILVKLWMMLFNRNMGRIIQSQTLLATAADSRNDVITTAAVLIAALLSRYAGLNLDGWMGLAVAVFIILSGFGLVKETLNPLLGRAPDDEQVKYIHRKILSYPGVLGTHDLLIHDYGPGRQFGSVHVEMAAEENVLQSHDVIDEIEQDFLKEGLHMLVHYDPIATEPQQTENVRLWLAEVVKQVDPKLTIHDLRMVMGNAHTKLVFDCLAPKGVTLNDKELRIAIETAVKAAHPDYTCAITIDHSFAAIPSTKIEVTETVETSKEPR